MGSAIERFGQLAIAQTIFSGKCKDDHLRRLPDELASLPEMPVLSNLHLQTERIAALDSGVTAGRIGMGKLSGSRDESHFMERIWQSFSDGAVALRVLNELYDDVERKLGAKTLED